MRGALPICQACGEVKMYFAMFLAKNYYVNFTIVSNILPIRAVPSKSHLVCFGLSFKQMTSRAALHQKLSTPSASICGLTSS